MNYWIKNGKKAEMKQRMLHPFAHKGVSLALPVPFQEQAAEKPGLVL